MIPLNMQPREVRDLSDDGSLTVHSIFETIQGEGPLAGTPAVFLRVAGCNLDCPRCDTDYTSTRRLRSVEWLMRDISELFHGSFYGKLVVITGGEPFRQNLTPLIKELALKECRVQVETNGTFSLPSLLALARMGDDPYKLLTIVCSPKTPKLNSELESFIDAYKYIIRAGEVDPYDGLPTKTMGMETAVARPLIGKEVYLQPLDEGDSAKNFENTQACLASCMKFGHRLSVQLHKVVGLP